MKIVDRAANYDFGILSKSSADCRNPLKTDSAILSRKTSGSLLPVASIALGTASSTRPITSSASTRSNHLAAMLLKCRR